MLLNPDQYHQTSWVAGSPRKHIEVPMGHVSAIFRVGDTFDAYVIPRHVGFFNLRKAVQRKHKARSVYGAEGNYIVEV